MTQVAQSTMGAPDPELNLPTDKALDVEGVKTMDLDVGSLYLYMCIDCINNSALNVSKLDPSIHAVII